MFKPGVFIAALAFSYMFKPTWAANVDADKIVRQGNAKGAAACAGCHGHNGAGQPAAGFPRLAGMNAEYLAKQLYDFKSGKRRNAIMQPIAKALSDGEVAAVTRYFADLPVPHAHDTTADPALVRKGEQLATAGDWGRNIPACFQCHGAKGQGIGPHFPSIAPQWSLYVRNQIRDWKNGSRHNDPISLMKSVAHRLTDDDVAAVAAFLAHGPIVPPGKQ